MASTPTAWAARPRAPARSSSWRNPGATIATSITCSAKWRSTSRWSTGRASAATSAPPSVRSRSAWGWSARRRTARPSSASGRPTSARRSSATCPCAAARCRSWATSIDGVAFPAAEVQLEFLDPADDEGEKGIRAAGGATFPTGNHTDVLDVPGVGKIEATLINAGNPTVFVDAASLGLKGTELQADINGDKPLLARVEAVRALGAVAIGDAATPEEATAKGPHTPKLAFVAKPAGYTASDGRKVGAGSIDLLARIFSVGA